MAGKLEKKIIAEIVEKNDDYEADMSPFFAEVMGTDELFQVKKPARQQSRFSNPRLTEFHRATIALGTLCYRMMTAKDPYFSAVPMDFAGDMMDPIAPLIAYEKANTIQDAMGVQLRVAKYKAQLLKANLFCIPFGTVICQEDYRVVGVNARGRKVPVTTFTPRVMDSVAFDRGATDFDDADFVSTMDVISNAGLQRLIMESEMLGKGSPWNKAVLEEAIKISEKSNTINDYVRNRIRRSVFGASDDATNTRKELLMYYGKLDCLNDGLEYVAALINRKILVRFHANNFQSGKRPFRTAKWIDWAGPLGLGLGQLFGPSHRSMDANRQKAQDLLTFSAYSPYKRRRGSVADDDLDIRPMAIIDVDDMNDLEQLNPSTKGAMDALKLEELMRAEFKAATGATDTLQALVTDATASEVQIAQSESLRRISVAAEIMAESLVREHLEVIHANNGQYVKEPFNVNRAGIVHRVYPADFQCDLDFTLKMTTDRDYKPKRLEQLLQGLQIITSTKSIGHDVMGQFVEPIIRQALHALDVPLSPGNFAPAGPMAAPPIDPAMLAQMGADTIPMGPSGAMQMTPIGPIPTSPT